MVNKNSQHSDSKEMAEEMEKKFTKYWEEYTQVLSWAVILDTQFKLKFMKFCFSKLDSLTCKYRVKVVEDNLHRLFEEYMKSSASNRASVGSTLDESDAEMRNKMDEFKLLASRTELNSDGRQTQSKIQ